MAVAGGSRRGTGRRRLLRNVLVVLLAAFAIALVTVVVVKTRADAREAKMSADGYTSAPITDPTAAALPIVAVIGDDTATRSASGIDADERWPALLAASADVDVRVFASDGAGYVTKGADGRTFLAQASRIPQDASVVVLFGGISDADSTELRLSRAASQTISTVQTRAPDARIAVVGPVTDGGAPTADVTLLRTTLKNAAGAFDLSTTDPIQQAWLNGSPDEGADLSASDERVLAARFETVVTRLLPTAS